MRLNQPCSPDCVKRSGICHSVCEEWKQYEKERNRRYEERQERKEAAMKKYTYKTKKRW